MKKKTLALLGVVFLPVGAILLNSCGPEASMDVQDVALDEVSNKWGLGAGPMYAYAHNAWITEYGSCEDGWDNDGNGLKDAEDPACHIGPGPLRDLSLFNFPEGNNFFPDVAKDVPYGPGYMGLFRDPAMEARWFRFLTQADGSVAGIDLLSAGVNPDVVPFPEPLPVRQDQGTWAQGNNNNLFVPALHEIYLDHDFLPPPVGIGSPIIPAPSLGAPVDPVAASAIHMFNYLGETQTIPGWGPRAYYDGGSQGAIRPVLHQGHIRR